MSLAIVLDAQHDLRTIDAWVASHQRELVTRLAEAYRVSVTTPRSQSVIDGLTRALGQPPVVLRTSGATVPMAELSEAAGAPAISVQTVNFDDNQHTHNENLRLGHLFAAVKTITALLTLR